MVNATRTLLILSILFTLVLGSGFDRDPINLGSADLASIGSLAVGSQEDSFGPVIIHVKCIESLEDLADTALLVHPDP